MAVGGLKVRFLIPEAAMYREVRQLSARSGLMQRSKEHRDAYNRTDAPRRSNPIAGLAGPIDREEQDGQ